uniref:Uncharacterized protein n=1 Tax=Arundo donax TaxID=35708 RepID=A0A0A8YPT7_ARUDO
MGEKCFRCVDSTVQ